MPQRDEGEDGEEVADGPEAAPAAGGGAAAQRDVDVAHDPAVEGAVPAAPEGEGGVVVAHAADHVLGRVGAVEQGPQPEEAPRQQQLQPDDVQIEVAEHAELEGRVERPGGLRFGDRDGVDEVQD